MQDTQSSTIKKMAISKNLQTESAFSRHEFLMREYLNRRKNGPKKYVPSSYKTERDIIRENHKFVRSDSEDEDELSWEERVAKKYYDRLFKEYAICELKYYKEGRIALRWRIEREVVNGKGQFICASTRCDATEGLKSWEVNFGYVENGSKKNELVKVRLCPSCSDKLNYKTQKRLAKRLKRKERSDPEDGNDGEGRKKLKNISDEERDMLTTNVDSEKVEEAETSVWSKTMETKEEKSKEEEYEDYFADLLQ
ncbi:folate-sensitive fragile site protein Fra10Ac1-domain-containing protein [Mycotypha africana]|uniref:folate-sensitive fragile site protein Fra10Ac1-domain-containing protein n=1 Tax=Mycotypha africana TaxID=64632 RepID=UPI0023005544|nr:folate-sensitive fragile site protein Fra10Ac1-domain-containing protein [Mycotypha africana]KAI8970438.1 folate-sensitive fragile site protein Fra10Ac1-domain-containing protein [Mycotypha africana]